MPSRSSTTHGSSARVAVGGGVLGMETSMQLTREIAEQRPFVAYPDGTKGRIISFDETGFTIRVPREGDTFHEWSGGLDGFTVLSKRQGAPEFFRVERYKDRTIISDGEVFMAFWSGRRYPSLEAIRNAIDTGAINSGTDDEFSPGADRA